MPREVLPCPFQGPRVQSVVVRRSTSSCSALSLNVSNHCLSRHRLVVRSIGVKLSVNCIIFVTLCYEWYFVVTNWKDDKLSSFQRAADDTMGREFTVSLVSDQIPPKKTTTSIPKYLPKGHCQLVVKPYPERKWLSHTPLESNQMNNIAIHIVLCFSILLKSPNHSLKIASFPRLAVM